jgi:hypothetical protein
LRASSFFISTFVSAQFRAENRFDTFPGIALTKQISLTVTVIGSSVLSTNICGNDVCVKRFFRAKPAAVALKQARPATYSGLPSRLRSCIATDYVHLE